MCVCVCVCVCLCVCVCVMCACACACACGCICAITEKIFGKTAEELEMHVVYDVSHNICKEETHVVDGVQKRLLVHRKGATRSFPPGHPDIPAKYAAFGQPVLVGGSMGTCSYVLTGAFCLVCGRGSDWGNCGCLWLRGCAVLGVGWSLCGLRVYICCGLGVV